VAGGHLRDGDAPRYASAAMADPRRFDEDAPTQVDEPAPAIPRASEIPPPSSSSSADGSRSIGGSSSRSLVTARETLVLQEVHRTRMFLRVAIAIALSQAGALTFLGGDRSARIALVGGLVAVVLGCGWLLRVLHENDDAYTVPRGLVAAFSTILAAFCGVYFYGVFSPAPIILPLGLQFYCTGESDRASFAVFAACTLGYGSVTGLTLLGVLPDVGLVRASSVPLLERAVMIVVVEAILVAVYVVARRTRSATLFAIERHDVVVRSLAQRDALLREARHDLAQAMRVGGLGRYSGEVVGSFRLGSVIGRGAMGEVYEGVALDTKAEVAVKLVHPQLLGEREVVDRFLREAVLTSALSSPNVVRVVDASKPDAPIPYLAMERLRGEDLATFLRDHKRMGTKKLLTMLREVAAGIDAAHAAGIIHRDLKPRNLFCARAEGGGEIWKVLDFGVSKLDTGEGTLTRGQLVGTPSYMAPEQARAEAVSPRADVFALAVIAYRALTGSPPFTGETGVEILFAIAHAMPLRPSELVTAREEVDLVLAIGLAKDPKDRFATAGEFAAAMQAAARGRIDAELASRARSLVDALPWGTPAR
jgi:eukaryotic-like serine/threonine-protein kinase